MVFIIIAVQKELHKIVNALHEKGYQVVDPETYNYPIDAMIYEDAGFSISHISTNNMPLMASGQRNHYGVLMVNSKGKTIQEIEQILKNRCYSPLF
ncbi:MAG: YkuS family protein [Clostridia bacterium]|nr:YkuS family protein [Clostridia bacterium]